MALTLGLGIWQIYRLHWKEGLLARIAQAEHAPPVPLGDTPPTQFERVSATGTLRPDLAVSYATDVRDLPAGPTFGVFLLEPLERPGAAPLLVDLGWVPADPHGRPSLTVAGTRTIDGYVRAAEPPSLFTPNADLAQRQFYALDPPAIGRALGMSGLPPFTLIALGEARAGVFPQPATSLPRPPNNHLQYAVTWFSLAAIVLIGTAIWWRGARARKAV
jgi:surfeit locus 1 family protein